jgi:hypothetical protein
MPLFWWMSPKAAQLPNNRSSILLRLFNGILPSKNRFLVKDNRSDDGDVGVGLLAAEFSNRQQESFHYWRMTKPERHFLVKHLAGLPNL